MRQKLGGISNNWEITSRYINSEMWCKMFIIFFGEKGALCFEFGDEKCAQGL